MRTKVRDATRDDESVSADFNSKMAEETAGHALDPGLINPGAGAPLADSTNWRYRVAETDDKVVGQIMVTYACSDWRNGMLRWIQSV